ncbi:hypothetical protein OG258_19880 [Streptomyces mirabilis]|uniref:hypothetical protein n=1 Tax=Streptomyces mirabilis TaxID=68239 RepID=UPI002E2DEF3C|nr:hypothetical protein [Streptomyces mirabilis]
MKNFRAFVDRLAKGSSILFWRMARGIVEWLKAGSKVSDFLIRLAFLGIPLGVLYSALTASRLFMWALVTLWLIWAYRAASSPSPTAPPAPPAKDEEAGQPETKTDLPGGGVERRIITWPDPDNPHRTHVRVVEERGGE